MTGIGIELNRPGKDAEKILCGMPKRLKLCRNILDMSPMIMFGIFLIVQDFALVRRQVHLEVGGDDFFVDLLFYHLKLHCCVVIELKTDKFRPEHLGQLRAFYQSSRSASENGRLIVH